MPLTLSHRFRSTFSNRIVSHGDPIDLMLQRFNCNSGPDTVNPSNAYLVGCINGTQIYLQKHATIMGGAGIAVACLMVRVSPFSFAFQYNFDASENPLTNAFPSSSANSRREMLFPFFFLLSNVAIIMLT